MANLIPTSVMCSECQRIAPNMKLAGQQCGEKMSYLDPGCKGVMVPVVRECHPRDGGK